MSGKHTPGPWHFHQPWAGFSKITGPNGELIFGIAAGHPDEKRPDPECEANAHLIASAPDLLEALKAVDRQVFCDCVGVATGTRDHQPGCYVPMLRAAIAKAEGSE